MPENLLISRMLSGIIAATSSALPGDDSVQRFARMIGDFFGIERVIIKTLDSGMHDGLYGYISNTKKAYVDNQLSEYSSFPELIDYKSRGFRSYAILPIVINGKVVSIAEMLSTAENKFSDELISSASFGVYMTSLTMLYKYENERNVKLASYFDSAFNVPVPQLLVSKDGRILKANRAAYSSFLASRRTPSEKIDDVLGLGFRQLASMQKKTQNKIPIDVSGQNRIYNAIVSGISDKLLHVSLQDISEPDKLSLILDLMGSNSYVGVLYLDGKYGITEATDSIKRAIGYDKSLIIGKNLIELTIERKRGEVKEMLEKQGQKQRIYGEMDLAAASGIPAHMRFVLSKWANGYVMLLSDATAEGYINGARSALSDFISSTSDAIVTMDQLGYVKDCNISAEKVFGYTKSELSGREMKSLYSDYTVLEKDLTYVRNGGKVDNSYAMFVGRDGRLIDGMHSIRLFRSMENADYIIMIKELETKRKISDLESLLDKERNTVKRFKATGDLKSQFIYNISHELKTPLTNIKGFSKLLYSGEFGGLNPEQLNYLGTIIEETDRLMLIIQQVLDAAKLESEKMKLDLREVDINELEFNPTMQSMKEDAKHKDIQISWHVAFDVPKIIADPNRLIQALVNLVGNSIKFCDKKPGLISIRVARLGKTKVKFDVIDNGIGISPEDQRKLFKKFYEAPKKGLVKQAASGTGLGLSITHEIVKLHGGRITCESEPGKGSTFSFTLRIKPKKQKQ